MPELTISGESIEEMDEFIERLHRAENLANSDLLEAFEEVIKVEKTLKRLTKDGGSVSRARIEEELGLSSAYYSLQLLQDNGIAKSGGQGGNWSYVGD
jgi:hypothetical protein